ncbi:MAG: 4Fe-4S dicluster domain-containing protein [Bacteroidales bacterium]
MYKNLRRLRIFCATIIFILITASFLNFNGGNIISTHILKIQFIPALISIFAGSFLAIIFLIILTLLFGRVYCSFLCPLGILQDIITRISIFFIKKAHKGKLPKTGKGYKKPHNILRYSILCIVALLFFAGITYPLALLDPYSNFGKIATQIFGTTELWINNILSGIFPTVFYYQQYVKLSLYTFIYAAFIFIIISIFSMLRGRLYCNTICPVGSILGLISGFSLFKPAIKKDMCIRCTACAIKCKSNCINLETKEIDVTRCVACYDCMIACKRGGVELIPTWFSKKEKIASISEDEDEKIKNSKNSHAPQRELESVERRNALIAIGTIVTGITVKKILNTKNAISTGNIEKETIKNLPIAPPGARSIEQLKANCTACNACVAACPNKIIKPSVLEYGLSGFMLPTIKYNNKFCAYDCNKCTQVCPNGALEPLTLKQKQVTQIGRAKYIAKNCIVFVDNTDCGACDEHCPTKAIVMTEVKNKPGLYFPKLNRNICIGCGACEYICPASPKAIVIEGNAIQSKSLPPKVEKQEEKKIDDFGF